MDEYEDVAHCEAIRKRIKWLTVCKNLANIPIWILGIIMIVLLVFFDGFNNYFSSFLFLFLVFLAYTLFSFRFIDPRFDNKISALQEKLPKGTW
jgi:hypothetical protein